MNRRSATSYIWLVLGAIFLMLLAASPPAYSQDDGTLAVTLFDPTGTTMAHAAIEVRWNDLHAWPRITKPAGRHKKWVHVNTDLSGRSSIRLAEGQYDIIAYHDLFFPTCTSVGVLAGQTTTLELRFPKAVPATVSQLEVQRQTESVISTDRDELKQRSKSPQH